MYRKTNGCFKKGVSGNPGGRPKEAPEVKELARQHSEEAIERLVLWMRSKEAKASVAACNAILDRAWGKPLQGSEFTSVDGARVTPVINVIVREKLPPKESNPARLGHALNR